MDSLIIENMSGLCWIFGVLCFIEQAGAFIYVTYCIKKYN